MERHDQPERAALVIEREHFGVVDQKLLVFGVKLDPQQAGVFDPVDLVERIRRIRVNRAERNDVVVIVFNGKAVDIVLLLCICRNREHDALVHAPLFHFFIRIGNCAVGVIRQSAGLFGKAAQCAKRKLVREGVRVKVNYHGYHLFSKCSITVKLYHANSCCAIP